ncbi:response regulator [Noviherbaspirillum sp.]|uniref:response regulator n=1 Tax=Noviherbaspirillum sp. TaxID=1926288 RepID=UPI002FE09300
MKGDKSILVVEDNDDDIVLVQRALKKAGITNPLSIAKDGEEAIEYLAGIGRFQDEALYPVPTMVLLDLKLPKRSGLEVLGWIRSHTTLATLPVVVFTTSTQSSDLEKAYALGANSYLRKPLDPDETAQLLKIAGTYWLNHNLQPPQTGRS